MPLAENQWVLTLADCPVLPDHFSIPEGLGNPFQGNAADLSHRSPGSLRAVKTVPALKGVRHMNWIRIYDSRENLL